MHAGEQEFDEVVGIAASTELRHCRAPESGVKAGSPTPLEITRASFLFQFDRLGQYSPHLASRASIHCRLSSSPLVS